MLDLGFIIERMLMLWPLVAVNMVLTFFCIVKIVKEGVRNLNEVVWVLIVAFTNLIGPILFLVIGRKKDQYDTCE